MTAKPLPAWLWRWAERIVDVRRTPSVHQLPDIVRAFIWHFLRQVKGLYGAMLTLEGLLAITVAASPWYIGRLIDLISGPEAQGWQTPGLTAHLWLGLAL